MDLMEMGKLLEQASEYDSEALAQLSIAGTICGGNLDCERGAGEKALKALKQSIRLIRETEKYIWLIKDNIKHILAWICGFKQLVARAPVGEVTAEYRGDLLSSAEDLAYLVMDLLATVTKEIFTPIVKVKHLKVQAQATLETILKFGSTPSLGAAVKLWAYAERGTIRFLALGSEVQGLSVQVFNLAGRKIFDSGYLSGNELEWHLQNDRSEFTANGIYLYVITVKVWDGTILRSEVKKLIVLR